MDALLDSYAADAALGFPGPEWALILSGAVLLRLLPALIMLGAVLKLRRFPEIRSLHILLLISAGLLIALALIETMAPALVPMALRTSGVWSFLWIFAGAWVAVTWVRSAIRTRLRPRGIDIATLACGAALALAASGLILPELGAT